MRGVTGLLARRRGPRRPQHPATQAVPVLPVDDGQSVMDIIAAEPEREFPGSSAGSPLEAVGAAFESAGGLFPAPVATAPSGQQPYGAQPATGPDTTAFRRVGPEWHPHPATVTAPLPVLPGNAAVPPPPPAPSRSAHARPPVADVPDLAVLRDVRAGLLKRWQAERAEEFSADRRQLPLFAAMTQEFGWTGLHVPVRSTREFRHQRWTVERWHRQADAATAAQTAAARAEARAGLDTGPAEAGAL